ncbi:MAG TPA: hypothetical protein VN253_07525 [Kofleriaceae bacterium]|nr:hypothetical protein [Kofleriaceae bacterium]
MARGGGPAVTPGVLAAELGGKVPIPPGTNLALGLHGNLEAFAEAQKAVSVVGAWERKLIGVAVGDAGILKSFFTRITTAFALAGGRIKFNLTALKAGIEGATPWELKQILKSDSLLARTDFYLNGVKLTGKKLEEALKPWR